MEIRDPVHGYVKLNTMAREIVETPEVQRLRWIKQLGLANLVYPGANHTRFEHSLGAYHLAGVLSDHLDLSPDERIKVEAAALLHDIGHGPLSHATEAALSPYIRQDHEDITGILRKTEVSDVLAAHGIDYLDIQPLVRGSRLGQIVSGEIDVDRMDYLIRDAHYTGVAYGVIDHLRLMKKMKIHQGELVVESGGIQAATSLLISRLLMHPAVYYHHVSRIAESMVAAAIHRMVDDGVKAEEIKSMDDMGLFSAMNAHGGYAAEITSRIKGRRLFKRAVYVGIEGLDGATRSGIAEKRIALEIAEAANVHPDYVLVDNPALPDSPEGDFPVLLDGETRSLRDVSPLVGILERAHVSTWRFGVYARPEDRERISLGAKKVLNLKKNAVQHTFADID